MGILGFLKKPKAETTEAGMELPPVPTIEGSGEFPSVDVNDSPPMPDNSLPPLPTDVPNAVPPKPEEKEIETPKVDLPEETEAMGAQAEAPEKVEPDMPSIPEPPQEDQPMPPPPDMPMPPPEPAPADIPQEQPQSEFPDVPEMPSHENIPDTIPPLEGLPDAPEYIPPTPKEELDTAIDNMPAEPEGLPPMHLEEDMPAATVPQEAPLKKMRRVLRGPAYLKTESFKAILGDIDKISTRAGEVDEMIFRLNDFKNGQDQSLEGLKQSIEDVQRKLLFIDKLLFDTRR